MKKNKNNKTIDSFELDSSNSRPNITRPVAVSGWGDPRPKSRNSGSQNNNLVITRRPDGPRSSRFQLSAYCCTLFLVRWVPGLKSFNLIDFRLVRMVSGCFGEVSGGVGGPMAVCFQGKTCYGSGGVGPPAKIQILGFKTVIWP